MWPRGVEADIGGMLVGFVSLVPLIGFGMTPRYAAIAALAVGVLVYLYGAADDPATGRRRDSE